MKRLVLSGLLSAALVLTGCGLFGTKEENPRPVKQLEPGFGSSQERPLGTPFTWPAGLVVLGRPADENCDDYPRPDVLWGNGGAVRLCLNLYNTTNQPIRLELPPGLMWVSDDGQAQNGFIINLISVEVPPGQRLFQLYSYCANLNRTATGPQHTYSPTPVLTQHPRMQELLHLLATKKINFEDYGSTHNATVASYSVPVQRAVRRISEGETIEPELQRELEALPTR